MLLTRSPLSPRPKPRFSLDLHVLSAPPAFVLSQDQTLRERLGVLGPIAKRAPEGAAERPSYTLRTESVQFELDARSSSKGTRRRVHFRSHANAPERSRRFTLLSFQRPRRPRLLLVLRQQKASDSHQRLSRTEHKVVSARSKALQSSSYSLSAPSFRKAEGW